MTKEHNKLKAYTDTLMNKSSIDGGSSPTMFEKATKDNKIKKESQKLYKFLDEKLQKIYGTPFSSAILKRTIFSDFKEVLKTTSTRGSMLECC